MQDAYTGLLMSYIFSYAIINELCIYYIINFLFFQERGEALGQPTAYLLLLGIGYLLPSHVRVNNVSSFSLHLAETLYIDTDSNCSYLAKLCFLLHQNSISWSTRTSPHPRRQSHSTFSPKLLLEWTKSTMFSTFDFNSCSWALFQVCSEFFSSNRLKILNEIKLFTYRQTLHILCFGHYNTY